MTRSKPPACSSCPLCAHGTDFSAIEGTGSSGVLLVGEASGEHEQRDGLPFRPYAPAGSLLERTFRRMGIDRKMFAITNAIRCRPRNNWLEGSPWEYSALAHCRKNLDAAIAGYHPRAIVALGGTALRELTGEAGEARGISHLAGYVLPSAHQTRKVQKMVPEVPWPVDGVVADADAIPVIGDFHPAFLRRGKASHQGVFARIIQRAVNIAAGKDRDWLWNVVPEDRSTHGHLRYQVHPSLDEAGAFAARVQSNGDLPLSYDLETFESASLDEDAREGFTDTQIRLIQFSLADGSGIAFPWEGAYREIARRVLHSENVKCGHNIWLFDNKVLRAASEREGVDYNPRGTLHDTLQMYHHWQPDLPAHLQFAASFVSFPFPWKHLAGTDIEFYGCADVDATLRLYTFLKAKLIGDGIWGDMTVGYLGQVACVRPVLAAMEDRGVPIDDAARVALGAEFEIAQRELGVEIAGRAPVACQRVHPKEGYKGVPPQIKALGLEPDDVYIAQRFQDPPTKSKDGTQVEDGEWYTYQRRSFRLSAALVDAYGEPTIATESAERWCRVYDFNPNSSQQLIAYMKSKGHKVPKSKEEDAEGNAKDTTAAKELQRLAARTSDDFYLKVIEYRGLTKMRGTYVDGFKPGADGRVHTTFTFDTGIGQLSCCAPWVTVLTSHGHKMIKDVKVGDLVWTHRRRWRSITHTWIHPKAPMVELHLSNGYVLTCTTAHKLLVSGHEHKQEVGDRGECSEGVGTVPEQGSSNSTYYRGAVGYFSPHSMLDTTREDAASGIQDSEQIAIFSLEDGDQESHAGQDRRESSQLEGHCGRWARVSDVLSGQAASVRASAGYGRGSGDEVDTGDVRCASYQQRSEGQSSEQSSISYEVGASHTALISATRLDHVTIEKVISVGSLPVHDITVEEDESYASCGVFSHNSRNPNTQNFPKLKPTPALAKAMRAMICADPGHIITEIDFKSCHVITLGHLAGDANYTRLGRLDIHSFVAGHFLNLWDGEQLFKEPDDVLLAKFKWLKSDTERKRVRDDQAKHGILGIGNGLRAKGLYERYMESFPARACPECGGTTKVPGLRGLKKCPACGGTGRQSGLAIAEQVLAACERLFPRVFEYQETQRKEAHERQVLRTPFGHQRRFYEVYRWDYRKSAWGHGDQAEQAVAYRLANTAHAHMREVMKELDASEMMEKYACFNQIHDSLMLCHSDELANDVIRDIVPIMMADSKVMPGLWMGVEASQGRRWSEMKDVNISMEVLHGKPIQAQDVGNAILGEGGQNAGIGAAR